jgi:hypothetical protein
VSYRGEKGKTTGYYVPEGAEEATREGAAAWRQMQQCLRQLAELNKDRNLQRAPRGRFAMTPWFRLTLVCCVLLCLLLGLTQAVDWNYQPVVRSGSSFDRGPTRPPVQLSKAWRSIWLGFDRSDLCSSIVGRLRAILVRRPAEPRPSEPMGLASCRQLKPTPSSNLPRQECAERKWELR